MTNLFHPTFHKRTRGSRHPDVKRGQLVNKNYLMTEFFKNLLNSTNGVVDDNNLYRRENDPSSDITIKLESQIKIYDKEISTHETRLLNLESDLQKIHQDMQSLQKEAPRRKQLERAAIDKMGEKARLTQICNNSRLRRNNLLVSLDSVRTNKRQNHEYALMNEVNNTLKESQTNLTVSATIKTRNQSRHLNANTSKIDSILLDSIGIDTVDDSDLLNQFNSQYANTQIAPQLEQQQQYYQSSPSPSLSMTTTTTTTTMASNDGKGKKNRVRVVDDLY